ncbi:MAG TPA: hypothetical protein GXX30_04425 [Firmicutes bacterium]|nr:hypothetical protein [Candidatus Fermentithermobacillaceae bacterium]
MSRRSFRWEYAVFIGLLVVGALSLAFYFYEDLGVKKPLEKALSSDPDVRWVKISQSQEGMIVEVGLGATQDLAGTYRRLHDTIKRFFGVTAFQLKAHDSRDQYLESVYHDIHYYLEEAAARGNFGEMIERCKSVLDQKDLDSYEVTVDHERIYVQLFRGDNYLYQVIERLETAKGGAGE